jgi:N-methylhydantoinase A
MHAGMLAGELGVKQVVIPPLPGTFSAWGMLVSRPRIDRALTRITRLAQASPGELEALFDELEQSSAAALVADGFAVELIVHQRAADMRYQGQEHTVRVPIPRGTLDVQRLRLEFDSLHAKNYTFALEQTPVEIVNFRTVSAVELERPSLADVGEAGGFPAEASYSTRLVLFEGGPRRETRVYRRSELRPGFATAGPAIVEEPSATTVVPPGYGLTVDRFGNLLIRADAT